MTRLDQKESGNSMQVCEGEHDESLDFQIGVSNWDINLSL